MADGGAGSNREKFHELAFYGTRAMNGEEVMDEAERKIAEQNLIETDNAIALGREDIAKQTQLIAELTRAGYDIQPATELLNTLHQSQTLLVEHRDQLRRELGLET